MVWAAVSIQVSSASSCFYRRWTLRSFTDWQHLHHLGVYFSLTVPMQLWGMKQGGPKKINHKSRKLEKEIKIGTTVPCTLKSLIPAEHIYNKSLLSQVLSITIHGSWPWLESGNGTNGMRYPRALPYESTMGSPRIGKPIPRNPKHLKNLRPGRMDPASEAQRSSSALGLPGATSAGQAGDHPGLPQPKTMPDGADGDGGFPNGFVVLDGCDDDSYRDSWTLVG